MSELDKFAEIFNRKLGDNRQAQLRFGVCKSVKWTDEERTMTATGVSDDVDYKDVQLGFGYIDIKPKQGSVCLIGVLEGQEALTFLINAEQVELVQINADKIEYNGGDFGGLVKIDKMVVWMQKVYTDLQTLKTQLSTHTVVGSGAPLALVFNSQTPNPQESDFENDKITH
jgi:hypothetical protein